MPVNCTQCGAALKKGQRFCTSCGAPVAAQVPRPENKPEMDLSPYFGTAAAPAARGAEGARRQPRPAAGTKKNDRGLNLALMICSVLAIGVVTFLLILLLQGRDRSQSPGQQNAPVPVSSEPQTLITPPPETGSPVVITPAPESSAQPVTAAPAPTAAPTPAPAPTPTPTPAPTPASDYLLPDSNSRYLTEADLSGLSHEQLCLARNEIFARHGRIFKTPEIAAYFNTKSWYKGTVSPENFNEKVLNQYEWANISFIRDYENKYYGGSDY